MKVELSSILSSTQQTRSEMDVEKLQELQDSIAENGLLNSPKLREVGNGQYEIVYGHRRVEACRRLGWLHIEAIIDNVDDTTALIQGLIENLQREDIKPLDEAEGYKRLQRLTGWSNREIAKMVGVSSRRVDYALQLSNEPPKVKELFENAHDVRTTPITAYHVREVSPIINTLPNGDDIKVQVLQKAASEGLTAQQTRRVAETIVASPQTPDAVEYLLTREYDPITHDPQTVAERTQRYGATDPQYARATQLKREVDRYTREGEYLTPAEKWGKLPEVAKVLEWIRGIKEWIKKAQQAAKIGKMSPEAQRFIARRLKQVAKELYEFAKELEGDNSDDTDNPDE